MMISPAKWLAGGLGWVAAAALAGGLEWNQFRGPNGSGVAPKARPPLALDDAHRAWQTDLPPGLSSPVLAGDRLFLTGVEERRLVTLAFARADGRLRWRRRAPDVPLERVHRTSSPAASTPCVDERRVYVYFGSYGLLCYDHEGREQWRRAIPTPKNLYGMATSPIRYRDLLILVLDNEANLPGSKLSQSKVVAFRAATGEPVWETPRPLVRSGWSTPMIWRHAQGRDLVVLGSRRVYGYDPDTGAEQWFVTGFSRETIAVPVAGLGHVHVSSAMLGGVPDAQPDPEPFWQAVLRFDANGDGRLGRDEMTRDFSFPLRPELAVGQPGFGLPLPDDPGRRKKRQADIFAGVDKNHDGFWTREEFLAGMTFRRAKPRLLAIRPGGRGDVSDTHVVWRLNRSIPEIPSPLFYQDRLYLVRNGGGLAAVDAREGKIIYRERLNAPGQYSASPVVARDHLYLFSQRGVASVVKTGDAFQLVWQGDLGEPVFVTPALAGRTIYVRTKTQLKAFRNRE